MIRTRIFGLGLAVIALIAASPAARGGDAPADDEEQIGKAIFEQLKTGGQIVATSRLYDYITQPNAFSVPGGNVYITDELLYFVRNTEQLAGTVCHEVAHATNHDSMKLIQKEIRIARAEMGAAVLLGPSKGQLLAMALLGKLRSLSYSRDAESEADLKGADICAASGWNPWGLVWLLEDFERSDNNVQIPQMLSNHPDNTTRIAALKQHFRENSAVFGSFSSNRSQAKPLAVPKDVPVVFLR
jgi:predicted Zn-dependent protease